MYSKMWTATGLALALALQVNAHAAVAPVLGLVGQPARKDVKRPNNINPCGAGVNIASEIDSSTAAPADANGVFNTVVTNFNLGLDGSRQVKAAMDPTGTGASFSDISVTTNGDLRSKDFSSQPIVAALPAGTVCTGGATGNKCLVQFKNAFGFGNCVVVSQDKSATAAAAVAGDATAALASTVAPAAAVATAGSASVASVVAPVAPPAVTASVASVATANTVAPPAVVTASVVSVAAPYSVAPPAVTASVASVAAPYSVAASAGSVSVASVAAGSASVASVAAPYAVATAASVSVASVAAPYAVATAGSVAPYSAAAAPAVGVAANSSGAAAVAGSSNTGVFGRGGTPAARALRAEMEGRSL